MEAQAPLSSEEERSDELVRLRARVAELERELERRPGENASREAEFRSSLYEAVLYGLARTLSLYDPASVRVLVREMGRRIREYLEELGYHVDSGNTVDEVIERTVTFFQANGFVDLEVLSWSDGIIRARWHRLLGLRAYERIVAAEADAFVSCPLNAMLQDSLEAFGKELTLVEKTFDLEREIVDSIEALVDVPSEVSGELSLNAERVLELEREQGRQLRVREDFIRAASHELATPLTSAKLALARLARAELPPDVARLTSTLKRQVERLEHLVTEMLDATHLQVGRIRMRYTTIDLIDITRGVIEHLGAGAQVELRGDSSVVGSWDAERIEQVLMHLIGNAIKYGQGKVVEVEVTRGELDVRVVVRDHGIGIDAAAKRRLFSPFERAVSVQSYGGLGLGLYISRRIVQMHGGTLTAESEPGEGATFTVGMPLAAVDRSGVLTVRGAQART